MQGGHGFSVLHYADLVDSDPPGYTPFPNDAATARIPIRLSRCPISRGRVSYR